MPCRHQPSSPPWEHSKLPYKGPPSWYDIDSIRSWSTRTIPTHPDNLRLPTTSTATFHSTTPLKKHLHHPGKRYGYMSVSFSPTDDFEDTRRDHPNSRLDPGRGKYRLVPAASTVGSSIFGKADGSEASVASTSAPFVRPHHFDDREYEDEDDDTDGDSNKSTTGRSMITIDRRSNNIARRNEPPWITDRLKLSLESKSDKRRTGKHDEEITRAYEAMRKKRETMQNLTRNSKISYSSTQSSKTPPTSDNFSTNIPRPGISSKSTTFSDETNFCPTRSEIIQTKKWKQPTYIPPPKKVSTPLRPPKLGGYSRKEQLGSVEESWGPRPKGVSPVYGLFQPEEEPPSRSTSPFIERGEEKDFDGLATMGTREDDNLADDERRIEIEEAMTRAFERAKDGMGYVERREGRDRDDRRWNIDQEARSSKHSDWWSQSSTSESQLENLKEYQAASSSASIAPTLQQTISPLPSRASTIPRKNIYQTRRIPTPALPTDISSLHSGPTESSVKFQMENPVVQPPWHQSRNPVFSKTSSVLSHSAEVAGSDIMASSAINRPDNSGRDANTDGESVYSVDKLRQQMCVIRASRRLQRMAAGLEDHEVSE